MSGTAGTATSTATNDMHKAQAALEAAQMTLAAASQSIKSALNLTELGPNLVAKPAVVAAEASISATAESLKAVKVALEALKEAQVQTIAAQDPGAALPSKGPANEGQLDDTVSIASSDDYPEDVEMDSSPSESSWAESSSSSSSDTSRCPSVMSTASSQGFPEAPFVSYGRCRDLTCSWVGSFALHAVSEGPLKGKNIFIEVPIKQAVPKSINSIRFEHPSEHMLVRVAGEQGYWVIMTGQPPCDIGFGGWLSKRDEELGKQSEELIKEREELIKRKKKEFEERFGREWEEEDTDDDESEDEEEGQSDGGNGPAEACVREIGS